MFLTERFQIEIHRATANQSVSGSNVFIEVVVFELRASVSPKHLFRREPNVTLYAAAAQSAQAGSVLPN